MATDGSRNSANRGGGGPVRTSERIGTDTRKGWTVDVTQRRFSARARRARHSRRRAFSTPRTMPAATSPQTSATAWRACSRTPRSTASSSRRWPTSAASSALRSCVPDSPRALSRRCPRASGSSRPRATRRSRTGPRGADVDVGRGRRRPRRRRARCSRAPARRAPVRAAGWLPVPQVVPGVVDKLFQPLTLEDLLLSGQATGEHRPLRGRGHRDLAAPRVSLRAALKPECTLGFTTPRTSRSRRSRRRSTISDELIEDAPAVQSFINGQLSLFVQIEVERQLLRGTSGGNEVQGLLTSPRRPGLRRRHRGRQQGGAALQGHERHARLGVRRAGVDRHASRPTGRRSGC